MANHALSCHRFLALFDQTPSIISRRTRLQRPVGLLTFPHRRHHSVLRGRAAATALLEPSTVIDLDAVETEAPSLLALSSDLDWEESVAELREAAIGKSSSPEMELERLGALMDGWLHDNMFHSIMEVSSLLKSDVRDPEEELGVKIRVEDLRRQAALQATEELARGVDRSFDWEWEAAELRQCVVNQERVDLEQSLWSTWESARQGMDKDAERLHDEALQMHGHADDSYLTLFPDGNREDSFEHEKSTSSSKALEISGTWWTLGVLAGVFGLNQALDHAMAADSEAVISAAAREAPGWVAPSVLAFPVVSYVLFTLYRNKVNPYAKLTDWMFGLVATAIAANIVLISTIGVRLY